MGDGAERSDGGTRSNGGHGVDDNGGRGDGRDFEECYLLHWFAMVGPAVGFAVPPQLARRMVTCLLLRRDGE